MMMMMMMMMMVMVHTLAKTGRQAGRQGEVHHTASRLEAEVAYAGYGRARAAIGG